MKLKRMWPSVCIWVVFIIFDVIMVASSGFFSGLFPSANIIPYTCAITIVGVLVMGLFTFLFGKASDVVYAGEISRTVTANILYMITLFATITGGIFLRIDTMIKTLGEPKGKLSLYENAMVGATKSSEYDLLSIIYSKLLNLLLVFTGNRNVFALYFQIVLFMLFVLVGAVVADKLLGMMASLVFALYVSFMPIFLDSVVSATIGTDELFYLMYGIELLILAFYLKLDTKHKYESKICVIWFIIVGMVLGFMTYVDAGTLIVVLPLLFAGLFIIGNDVLMECIRLVIIIISGLAVFMGMIFQEGGIDNFESTLFKWGSYFFKNVNTFNTFWTYTNYKIEYLVTFIVMSGVIVGFWKNRIFERVTPWLLSTMLVFFATPFFGATKMNSQVMLTIYFAFVLGCVASLIVTDANEGNKAPAKADDEAEGEGEAEAESGEDSKDVKFDDATKNAGADAGEKAGKEDAKTDEGTSGMQVVTPEVAETHTGNAGESEDSAKTGKRKRSEFADLYDEANGNTPEKVVDTEQIEDKGAAFDGYAQRFVPEGMVLPEGAEDEMDVTQSKMKMPEYKGTIALDRKKQPAEPKQTSEPKRPAEQRETRDSAKTEAVKKPSRKPARKDDFDIAFTPGDDFDL